jgi:hypothetical protein
MAGTRPAMTALQIQTVKITVSRSQSIKPSARASSLGAGSRPQRASGDDNGTGFLAGGGAGRGAGAEIL